MSIGETFYLLFKSNAKEVARDTKAAKLGVDQLTESTGKADDKAKQLGKSYTSAIESATQALAAYFSFNAMKSGVIDAQQFNRELAIQSRRWGENTSEVAAYASAIKTAGGNAADLYGWYDKIFKDNASRGAGTRSPNELLDEVHNRVKGLDAKSAQLIFEQYGIDSVYMQDMLRKSDEEYKKAIENGRKLSSEAARGSKAAEQWGESYGRFSDSLKNFWTQVGSIVLPVLSLLFDGLTNLIQLIASNKLLAGVFFTAMVAGATALSLAIPGIIAGFGGMGAAAAVAAAPLALLLAQLLAIVAVAVSLPEASKRGGKAIAHFINRQLGRGDANGILPGKEGYSGPGAAGGASGSGMRGNWGERMKYLMGKGFTQEEAAAWVSMDMHESGGNPGARGDGGAAHGSFQWQNMRGNGYRRDKIKAGTGIDVSNAGWQQQYDAAIWEYKQMGLEGGFKNASGADGKAAFLVRNFEMPADQLGESMKRGRSAIQLASETPFASAGNGGGGGSTSVSIGEVNINTQANNANDIAKEAAAAFKREIKMAHAQSNDAVAY